MERSLKGRKSGWLFTASLSKKYPNGDHFISTKHLNEDFIKLLGALDMPTGRHRGFTIHSLRRSFKSICVNAQIPRELSMLGRTVHTFARHEIFITCCLTTNVGDS